MIMTDDAALRLQIAVINQAKKDYVKVVNNEPVPDETIRTMRNWLQSEESALFRGGAEPEAVIDNWNMQAEYYKWRKDKGCPTCKVKPDKCIHTLNNLDNYTKPRACRKEVKHEAKRD